MHTVFSLPSPIYITSCASVAGPKEGDGPLHNLYDLVLTDPMAGQKTWEASESYMQKSAASLALSKTAYTENDISLTFAGDLLAQTIASSFGAGMLNSPFYGLYSACSTIGEALSLGAVTLSAGYPAPILCITSSHFASAEKEFRFPLGYGNQRPLSASWTVTGSAAFILEDTPPSMDSSISTSHGYAAITAIIPGKAVDYGIKDSMNMGACMAPAASDTIARFFLQENNSVSHYDKIFTGDLGVTGKKLLLRLLKEQGLDITFLYEDCGLWLYDTKLQDTHNGGSGCGCSALVLAAAILPRIASGEWKRILFIPTGALLSKVSFNEGETIPGIAHGIVIEHISR